MIFKALKVLPLIVGLFLTFFLPKFFNKRTHELAINAPLIEEQNKASLDTLDYILGWRDMINAVVLGLFVLLFSIDEDVTSTNSVIAFIAISVTVGLIPIGVIVAIFLADKLELASVKNKRGYWWTCIIIILLCYALSLVPIFLPGS